jgi:cell division protein FtsL
VPEEVYRLICFLTFLVVVCTVVYLYVQPASQISAARLRIAELQTDHARLQRENAELTCQLATFTDIRRVEERAHQLGYRAPDDRIFVRLEMAASDPLAATQDSDGVLPAVPWWQAVLDWATTHVKPPAYAQARR